MTIEEKIFQRAARVRLLVLDVDGVLTDGRLYFADHGEHLKVFHVHDGFGLRSIIDRGIEVAIISGRKSAATAHRMMELGISEVHLGCTDKSATLLELASKRSLQPAQIAAMGDDMPDLPMLKFAGLAIAVANAVAAVREEADWVTSLAGGHGAVRETCDLLLAAQST